MFHRYEGLEPLVDGLYAAPEVLPGKPSADPAPAPTSTWASTACLKGAFIRVCRVHTRGCKVCVCVCVGLRDGYT